MCLAIVIAEDDIFKTSGAAAAIPRNDRREMESNADIDRIILSQQLLLLRFVTIRAIDARLCRDVAVDATLHRNIDFAVKLIVLLDLAVTFNARAARVQMRT